MKRVHEALNKVRRLDVRKELSDAIQHEMIEMEAIAHGQLFQRIAELQARIKSLEWLMDENKRLRALLAEHESEAA